MIGVGSMMEVYCYRIVSFMLIIPCEQLSDRIISF